MQKPGHGTLIINTITTMLSGTITTMLLGTIATMLLDTITTIMRPGTIITMPPDPVIMAERQAPGLVRMVYARAGRRRYRPSYNLARSWAHYGSDAGGPSVGAIVVWRHHVGKIVGRENGQWIVQSGNDGHAIRTRPRSIAGAIAFRRA